jgi:CheY-like chemotaxis protein/rubrerythrin
MAGRSFPTQESVLRDIINWLMNVESLAAAFYREVAEAYEEDRKIADFFNALSAEESWHLQVMKNALQCLPDREEIIAPFTLDGTTKEKIEAVFTEGSALLAPGGLDREKLLARLVTAEFSEWNDVFVYALNALKEKEREFAQAAAKIQRHLREIEKFLEDLPEGKKHLYVIRCLPPVWHEKILIVEDQAPIREFLKAVLKHEGAIESAPDGKEALSRLREEYFDVVISDIGMPKMDGIEFYKKAAELDPDIGARFLFITGRPDEGYLSFFESNKLRFLVKPTPIKEIKRHIDEILHGSERKS